MKTIFLVVFILTVCYRPASWASELTFSSFCESLFFPNVSDAEIEKNIESLSRLRISIDLANVHGNRSLHFQTLLNDYAERERALIKIFNDRGLNGEIEIKKRIQEMVARLQQKMNTSAKETSRQKSDEAREIKKTSVPVTGEKIILNEVAPGSFSKGEVGEQIPVKVERGFELAATQTTQYVWRKVVERINASKPHNSLFKDILYLPSKFKGEFRPVENISYSEIESWLNAVNTLAQMDDPLIFQLFPGHRKGDIYRLPTQTEREFVVRGRGLCQDVYWFGNDPQLLGKFAWFDENSQDDSLPDGGPHPVATKDPIIVDNKEFYDLHGNIPEWLEQLSDGATQGAPVTTGSWNASAHAARSAGYSRYVTTNRFPFGFRIVRERL